MTSLLILSAFAAGIALGRKHRKPLPIAASRIKFIEQFGSARDHGATEYEFFWREREE